MKFLMICPNKACPIDKDIYFDAGDFRMVFDPNIHKFIPKLKGKPYYCPVCGSELKFVEVETDIPSFSVNSFASLPDEEKKRVLRQRFDADMKRGGKDQKEVNKRKAVEKLVGYDKQ